MKNSVNLLQALAFLKLRVYIREKSAKDIWVLKRLSTWNGFVHEEKKVQASPLSLDTELRQPLL